MQRKAALCVVYKLNALRTPLHKKYTLGLMLEYPSGISWIKHGRR